MKSYPFMYLKPKKGTPFGSTHGFILLPSPLYVSIFVPFRAPLYVSIFAPFRLKKGRKIAVPDPGPPLFLDQTNWGPKGRKNFFGSPPFPPPAPLSKGLDDPPPPPPPFISRSGSGSSCGLIQDGLFTNWKLGFDSDLRLHDFNLLVLETSD